MRGVLHIWEDGACTPFERSELRRNGSMDMGGGDRALPARPSGPRRANATPDRAAGRAQQAQGPRAGGQTGAPSTGPSHPGPGTSGLPPQGYARSTGFAPRHR